MSRVRRRRGRDRRRQRLDRRHRRVRARALPGRARDRAGEPRHGGRQQQPGCGGADGRYFFLLNSDAWVVGDGLAGSSRSRTRIPDAAVVGPRLLNPDGTLQRSVRGEPTLWRLATEYLFIRKLAPRSNLLNPLYVGRLRPRSAREVDWLSGRGAARPARGGRRGRAVRRELLHVQRRGRLDDALPAGRLEGVVLPGRRGRARRRRLPRRDACTSRTCAASFAASTSTAGRRHAERVAAAPARVVAAARPWRAAAVTSARACAS